MPLPAACLLAFLAGGASVLSFEPFGHWWLIFTTVAAMLQLARVQPARCAAIGVGFCFALGLFVAGVGWVYVSMAKYGGLPPWAAAALTFAFCAYLAGFHALFAAFAWSLRDWREIPAALCAGGLWAGSEWLREVGGFPWLSLGYSQVPYSPIAEYVPVMGVFGASAAVVVAAWVLSGVLTRRLRAIGGLAAIGAVFISGATLAQVSWTRSTGEVTSVALVQGNVPQDMKWRRENLDATLQHYVAMVEGTSAGLVVLPETAFPLFAHDLPATYMERLRRHATESQAMVAFGIVEREESTAGTRIYNSALGLSAGETFSYEKQRLVPFGEYVPLRPLLQWATTGLDIPMSDMTPGAALQESWVFAGQNIAVNICFEDVFGGAIARAAKPSTLLLNMSNLAWFGDSTAASQHLQIAQARSLETGRYSARATNTGATAVIDPRGKVVARLPERVSGTLLASVEGFVGITPYMRWTEWPILSFALLGLLAIKLRPPAALRPPPAGSRIPP